MGTTAWTEEDRAAVKALRRAAIDQWFAQQPDGRNAEDVWADVTLDLLAGLRSRLMDVAMNTSLLHPDSNNEHYIIRERAKQSHAIAAEIITTPLLPSDGPAVESKES